jgi:hypothetical protein
MPAQVDRRRTAHHRGDQALLGIRSETRWLRFLPRPLDRRLRAGRMRPLTRHRHVLRTRGMDRLRLLLPPLAVLPGLRPRLLRTPAGLPVTWAMTTPKLDERQVPMAILDHDRTMLTDRPDLLTIADKGCISPELDDFLAERGSGCCVLTTATAPRIRPSTCSSPVRQLTESVNDTPVPDRLRPLIREDCLALAPDAGSLRRWGCNR